MKKKQTGHFLLAEEPRTFEAAIAGYLEKGYSKADAVRNAVHCYPALHDSYLVKLIERAEVKR